MSDDFENQQEYVIAYSEHSYLSSLKMPKNFGLGFSATETIEIKHHEITNALLRQLQLESSRGNPNSYRVFVAKAFSAYFEQEMVEELKDLAEKLIGMGCFFFNLYSERGITLFHQAVMTNSSELISLFIEQASSEAMSIPRMKESMIIAIQCGKIDAIKTIFESGYIDLDDLRNPIIAEFMKTHGF